MVPAFALKSAEWRRADGDWSAHSEDGRDEALERDNHECQRCGEDTDIEVHHLIPRSAGGPDKAENLVTLCSKCHSWVHAAGFSQLLEERSDLYEELREAVCDED
ncbi:HNH endonuclease [Natrarchaeobius halalkaliphilus]